MNVAIATGQPLAALLEADSVEVATWLEILEENAAAREG